MKTNEKVVNFCNGCKYDDHHKVQSVIQLKHVRDCINNVLSDWDFTSEDNCIRVPGIREDTLWMFIDRNVENISLEKNLRVGILQLLCLEELYKEEADGEN